MGQKNLSLPSGRGHYTDWELRQSVEEKILLKSSCAAIQDNFGVPKTSLQRYLNVLFPSLKCSSLKHLWYLMRLGAIRSKTVRYCQIWSRTWNSPSQGQRSIHCGNNRNRRCTWPSKGYFHHLLWTPTSAIWRGSSRRQQHHYTRIRTQVCPQSNCECK